MSGRAMGNCWAGPESAGARGDLALLYDDLGRYQWWGRRLRGAGMGKKLEMHKRLRSSPNGVEELRGAPDLNAWLWHRLDGIEVHSVLDLGAGFGATLFDWARRAPAARMVGLGLSAYQVAKARRVARQLGLSERVAFHHRDNATLAEGVFQVIVSIETLFHAPDLTGLFSNLVQRIEPGGRLVVVEDMARSGDVQNDADAADLLEHWSTSRLHCVDDYRAALAASGWRIHAEIDLTPCVPAGGVSGEAGASERRQRRLRWLYRWSPFTRVRRVLRAFLGGVCLERLYANERMSYRAIVAESSGGGGL